ncbi:MAG: hypothetical protein J7515_14765 [Caulobacter sp.]|nr:hypothetical protein [Caulobacter sp.]
MPPSRVAGALIAGTLTGSSLLAALIVAVMLIVGLLGGGLYEALGGGLMLAALFFLFSAPVWAAGLVVIGVPGWIGLHALGWRSPWAGAAFGGVATFIVAFALGLRLYPEDPGKPWTLLLMAGVLAPIGAIVGRVVVMTAYDGRGAA